MIRTLSVQNLLFMCLWMTFISGSFCQLIFATFCAIPIGYLNYYQEIITFLQEKVDSVFNQQL